MKPAEFLARARWAVAILRALPWSFWWDACLWLANGPGRHLNGRLGRFLVAMWLPALPGRLRGLGEAL